MYNNKQVSMQRKNFLRILVFAMRENLLSVLSAKKRLTLFFE